MKRLLLLAAIALVAATATVLAPPAQASRVLQIGLDMFQNERAAFMLNWPYVYAALKGAEVKWMDDLAWTRYPQTIEGEESKPPLGGIEMGVNSASDNKEAAWDAVECITSVESQKTYMLGTGNPAAHTKVYDDPEMAKPYPMKDAILETLKNASVRPRTPAYQNVSTVISTILSPPADIDPQRTAERLRADGNHVVEAATGREALDRLVQPLVGGIYTADPKKKSDATRYESLSYNKVLSDDLKVMDATAISLARENDIPILVFSIREEGNFAKVLRGEGNFTIVTDKKGK